MGNHNRPYPSLEWVGVDCELIIWRNGLYDDRVGAVALCPIPAGEVRSPAYVGQDLIMSYADLGDLTPRRGLVYDAIPI